MSREVNMEQGTEEWYVAMAAAIKKREHAENGVARWQAQVAQAEKEIQALTAGVTMNPNVEQAPEQE
jgi:hypothetical protein